MQLPGEMNVQGLALLGGGPEAGDEGAVLTARMFDTDGTRHGDINRDGYSEEVAFDRDQDGRIDSVDTTGQGSSTDQVDAEQVVAPESDGIIDRHPGEDDTQAEESQAAVPSDSNSGGGSYSSDSDVGSTTIDSGSSDPGGTESDGS